MNRFNESKYMVVLAQGAEEGLRALLFDDQGNYPNGADALFRRIATVLAPDHAPPTAPGR